MTIDPGARLGPYEIAAKLGEGGMGAVWRATDTHLGREVALKLLPGDFADDPERQARFEREARTLASLNHPNIAVVHALEHLDGRHLAVDSETEAERTVLGAPPGSEPFRAQPALDGRSPCSPRLEEEADLRTATLRRVP